MTTPLSTQAVDVNFKDPTVLAESTAPAGSTPAGVPTVGTNQVARWELWDPNRWWTDWRIPPQPQATWERWFDWVQQLQRQTPAIRAAAADWRTLTTQLDEGLQAVQRFRPDLATWTGPTGLTMSQSLDNLERAVRTRADAIRDNPVALERLATSIEDSVGPMTELDAEYQQVLNNDAQCRAVALRGAPIMVGLADQLLTVGNSLQNSARDETRAPMPAPVQPLVLQSGTQGPTAQLQQVAAGTGNADPGTVTPGTVVRPPAQPTVMASDGATTSGAVAAGGTTAGTDLPAVSASPSSSDLAALPVGAAAGSGGATTAVDRLTQSTGLTDPGAVPAGTVVQPAAQPAIAASSGTTATGTIPATGSTSGGGLPDVMLAGGSAGTAAPAAPAGTVPASYSAPAGGPPGAGMAATGTAGVAAVPVGSLAGGALAGALPTAGGMTAGGGVPATGAVPAAAMPVTGGMAAGPAVRPGATDSGTSGRVAVPGSLLGRTGPTGPTGPTGTSGPRQHRTSGEPGELLDSDVWRTDEGPDLSTPRDR